MKDNIFSNLTVQELKDINIDRLTAKEAGLRPRIFDPYIEKIRKIYPLTVAEAWTFVEDLFFEEICKRFFDIY